MTRKQSSPRERLETCLVEHDDLTPSLYTSGTKPPKGAIITHDVLELRQQVFRRITPETVQLVILPLFHTGGLNCYSNPCFTPVDGSSLPHV